MNTMSIKYRPVVEKSDMFLFPSLSRDNIIPKSMI